MSRGAAVRFTADGAVFTSGKPVRLYGATVTSGATPGVVEFRNGTAASDNSHLTGLGTANATVGVPDIPAEGMNFPAGLFVDIDDSGTTTCVVYAELMSAS